MGCRTRCRAQAERETARQRAAGGSSDCCGRRWRAHLLCSPSAGGSPDGVRSATKVGITVESMTRNSHSTHLHHQWDHLNPAACTHVHVSSNIRGSHAWTNASLWQGPLTLVDGRWTPVKRGTEIKPFSTQPSTAVDRRIRRPARTNWPPAITWNITPNSYGRQSQLQ